MLVKDSETINSCRYSENIPGKYRDYILVADKSDGGGYSGEANFLAVSQDGNDFVLISYPYGSCTGCDDWEARDLSDVEIEQEIEKCTLHLTLEEFKGYKSCL